MCLFCKDEANDVSVQVPREGKNLELPTKRSRVLNILGGCALFRFAIADLRVSPQLGAPGVRLLT